MKGINNALNKYVVCVVFHLFTFRRRNAKTRTDNHAVVITGSRSRLNDRRTAMANKRHVCCFSFVVVCACCVCVTFCFVLLLGRRISAARAVCCDSINRPARVYNGEVHCIVRSPVFCVRFILYTGGGCLRDASWCRLRDRSLAERPHSPLFAVERSTRPVIGNIVYCAVGQ